MFTVLCKKACAETSGCRPLLTVGMSKAETVEFAFSPEWDGLTKTAVFTDGTVTVDVLRPHWRGNTVDIPPDVITTAGRYVRVGVYGSNADGVALPTIWAELGKVRPGADPSGDESTDPSLPVWAQLQEIIGDLDDLTTKAKNTLVAAINEAAKTGSGGSGSIDLRVADGYIQYSNDGGATWENLIALADLKGEDGYSPSASVSETDTGATITITDKTGTTIAEIKNGKDGKDGADGAPGKDGTNGADGAPGAKGDPGPNLISAETATALTGLLKGNGATVETAIPGTDYLAEPELVVTIASNDLGAGEFDSDTAQKIFEAAAAGKQIIVELENNGTHRWLSRAENSAIDNADEVGSIAYIRFTVLTSSAETFEVEITVEKADETVYTGYWSSTMSTTNLITEDSKTTSITPSSTNGKIPTAKAVYDAIPHPETKSAAQTQPVGVDTDGKLWTQPGGGSTGLPTVTADDNGKFLRVVNGAWAAAEIASAGGVSF